MIAAQHDEVLRLRDADDQAEDDAGLAELQNHVPGAERVVGRIVATQPTANKFYRVTLADVLGTEAEGQAGVLTADTVEILAFNIGQKAPPAGAIVLCVHVPYRWVFCYGLPAILPVT